MEEQLVHWLCIRETDGRELVVDTRDWSDARRVALAELGAGGEAISITKCSTDRRTDIQARWFGNDASETEPRELRVRRPMAIVWGDWSRAA